MVKLKIPLVTKAENKLCDWFKHLLEKQIKANVETNVETIVKAIFKRYLANVSA